MVLHVKPNPGRVNEYIAFDCLGDAERCYHARTTLAGACSALVRGRDVSGSDVVQIERLDNGKLDWLSAHCGATDGIMGNEMIEAHRPLLGDRSPYLVVLLSYDVDVDDIDAKLERFAATHLLTLVRRHGPFGQIERFAR